ncbi:MAG: hypothetical protein ACJA0N_000006 [Pseudohongiellaceae bacterium]
MLKKPWHGCGFFMFEVFDDGYDLLIVMPA